MSFDCGSYSDSCSEDDSDSGLAELEARLYSQYHYQESYSYINIFPATLNFI